MRKVLSLLALLFAIGAFAQPRPEASCDLEGINIRVKTCIAEANGDVIVTFTMENVGKPSVNVLIMPTGHQAYDDEGNTYEWKSLAIAKGRDSFKCGSVQFNLPKDVPVKARLRISNVDSTASMFRLIKINMNKGWAYLKNIPITRDGD